MRILLRIAATNSQAIDQQPDGRAKLFLRLRCEHDRVDVGRFEAMLHVDVFRRERIVDDRGKSAAWIGAFEFGGLVRDLVTPFMDVAAGLDSFYIDANVDVTRQGCSDVQLEAFVVALKRAAF